MPLTSQQIASMNGGYQSMAMSQMTHAGMIGMQAPQYGGQQTFGERMMAGGANTASAMAPIAGVGAGLLGEAAGGAVAAKLGLGMAGSIGMGLAGAGVAGAGLMAGQYVGSQMMTGMQQNQQMGAMMRQNYGHMFGPQGPTHHQIGNISQVMRQMSTQQGDMGQMASFDELGRLASKMGRMGMSQGARDAKEFTDKFKQMVSTLKEVAKEMGTSLEEAQKMMQSVKGSGIFGQGNQAKALVRASQNAMAGGLATSEVTGMMNIGSQISRMIGGRGRAGAAAGMESITNIGVAQQMGMISEEDVYNVTGLTGAEGRQAMSTQMLQQSAKFLKGGLGRRIVAAMAGKNGQLDENAVQEFMGGGVGTGRTMQLAHGNLAKVGRANFIRNEGKIRGEIMGRFGGLMPAIAMRGWLQQRGMDPGSDRAMIFAQRRLGLGNDEAEQMMKMVQQLPQLMQERRIRGQEIEDERGYMQKVELQKRHTGIEGLKTKFESARAKVQARLQQVGADFMESGSEMIDRFVNKLTGRYVQTYEKDAMALYRTAMGGGAIGDQTFQRYFGGQGNIAALTRGGTESMRQSIFGGGGSSARNVEQFRSLDAERFQEAGYGAAGGVQTMADVQRVIDTSRAVSQAVRMGGKGVKLHEHYRTMGHKRGEEIRSAFAMGKIQGKGTDRLNSFGKFLREMADNGSADERALANEYMRAPSEKKAQMYSALTGGAGALTGEHEAFDVPNPMSLFGAGKFGTVGERNQAIGKAFLGERRPDEVTESEKSNIGTYIGIGVGVATGGMGLAVAGVYGAAAAYFADQTIGGTAATNKLETSVGAFLSSEKGRDLTLSALGGSEQEQQAVRRQMQKEAQALQRKSERTAQEEGDLFGLKGILATQEISQLRSSKGELSDEDWKRLESKYGQTRDTLERQGAVIGASAREGQYERIRQVAGQVGARARDITGAAEISGTLVRGESGALELNADVMKTLGGIGKKGAGGMTAAQRFVQAGVSSTLLESQMRGEAGAETSDLDLMGQVRRQRAAMGEEISGMSDEELQQLQYGMASAGMTGEMARSMTGMAASTRAMRGEIRTGIKRGAVVTTGGKRVKAGGMQSIAQMMGVQLTKEDLQALGSDEHRIGGGISNQGTANLLLQRMGADGVSEGLRSDLTQALALAQKGDVEGSQAAFGRVTQSDEFRDAQKKMRMDKQTQEDPLGVERNSKLDQISQKLDKLDGIKTAVSGLGSQLAKNAEDTE